MGRTHTPVPVRRVSTRLTRKGALIEETHAVFRHWDLNATCKENLERARTENTPGADNEAWLKEIISTLSSRFGDDTYTEALILMAQHSDIEVWRPCLLWYIGQTDELYYQFALQWLFEEFQAGAFVLRTLDVEPFVRDLTTTKIAGGKGLSDYGVTRAARDLLKMASDFGLIRGATSRQFCSYHLPEDALLFILHAMAEQQPNGSLLVQSPDWRLFLIDREDVERELFRLHQFHKLQFEIAGSIARLELPFSSASEFAKGFNR